MQFTLAKSKRTRNLILRMVIAVALRRLDQSE
jgi:hypothetical protein